MQGTPDFGVRADITSTTNASCYASEAGQSFRSCLPRVIFPVARGAGRHIRWRNVVFAHLEAVASIGLNGGCDTTNHQT